MESAKKIGKEIPVIQSEDYASRLRVLQRDYCDPIVNQDGKIVTEEFRGELITKGQPKKFIHEILTVTTGVKVYTQASSSKLPQAQSSTKVDASKPQKALSSPGDVEYYVMWIMNGKDQREKLYINTPSPELAREIHDSFFQKMKETDSAAEAVFWLTTKSKFATLKSPRNIAMPFVDLLQMETRQKLRDFKSPQESAVHRG